MVSISEVLDLLHELREDIIIGNRLHPEKEKHYYSELPKVEYQSKSFKKVLCGQITELFLSKIRMCGYSGTRVFMKSPLMSNQYDLVFDKRYIMAVVENDLKVVNEYENKIIFVGNKKHTHGILETVVDQDKYIIDPKAGLIYPMTLGDLRKGGGLRRALLFMNQYEYILNSYHMQRPCTPIYATSVYWKSIRSAKHVRRFSPNTTYVDYFQKTS